jgi:hypothetical protein
MTQRTRRAVERSDAADAFVPEPNGQGGLVNDDLAEYLGEVFVATATGGDDGAGILQDDVVVEELGGAFVETDAGDELGAIRRARSAADEPGTPETLSGAVRRGRRSGTRGRS